jgi:cytochrome P450
VRLLREPLTFVCAQRERGGVTAVRGGALKTYLVNDPELVRQLLADEIRPSFQHRRPQIKHDVWDMRQIAEERIGAWPVDEVLQLDDELNALLVTMATRTLFPAGVDDASIAQLREALKIIPAGPLWHRLEGIGPRARLPLPANRRFDHATAALHAVVDQLIDRQEGGRDDLLSPRQLHDEVVAALMTGSATTRTTLSWACHLLSRNPQIQRDVRNEVDAVLEGRPPTAEDLDRLPYTRRVITETLRLYPAEWLLVRRVTADVDLGSYRIPAGADVCYSAYAIQRDPALYPDPDRFVPDRWGPGRESPPHVGFVAFGAGHDAQFRESLAWAEAMTTLVTIVQRWTLTPEAGVEIKPAARMLLMPQRLPIVPRSHNWPGM